MFASHTSTPRRGTSHDLRIATWQHRLAAWALNYVLFFLTFGIGWLIWSLVLWGRGQNPGRQILKIKAFSEDTGKPASWGHTCIYEFLFILAVSMVCGLINLVTFGIIGSLLYFTFWVTDFFIDLFKGSGRRTLRDRMCRILTVDVS